MRGLKALFLITIFLLISITKGSAMSIYDFEVKDINGNDVSMSKYKGKVLLIVNVASKCGFTNQYEGLEKLYQKYKKYGFEILGFPSNQFMNQEPGTNKEIQEFCRLTYGVQFDMFAKVDVNGDDAIPLYKYLKEEAKGTLGTSAIKWNFTKFLINSEGKVIQRYGSVDKPEEIEEQIVNLINGECS